MQILRRLSAELAQPMAEAPQAARQQPVAYIGETGAPTGRPTWQWVMHTPVATVILQGLSRSTAAVIELLVEAFSGFVVSDPSGDD